jgi:hypothetical protein
MAEWIFSPGSVDGYEEEGSPHFEVFRQQERLDPAEVLVREAIQNSIDARIDPSQPVRVSFDLREIGGDRFSEVLEVVGFSSLEPHLESVASREGTFQDRIRTDGLPQTHNGPVRILTVSDFGTKGMTGSEGLPEEEESARGNFYKLLRASMTTHEEADASKGGSYGLGKAIFWMMSGIASAIVYSIPSEGPNEGQPRLIGRSWLPSHKTVVDGHREPWSQNGGWFGKRDLANNGTPRAVSLWGDEAVEIADSLGVKRDGESGTSISILAFDDPKSRDEPSLEEFVENLVASVKRWYWPAITGGNLSVEIRAIGEDGHELGEVIETIEPDDPLVGPFLRAWRFVKGEDQETNPQFDQMLREDFEWRVPRRTKAKTHDESDVGSTLGVCLEDTDGESTELANSVALMRGATGMVVDYRRNVGVASRFSDRGQSYFGVLLTGRMHGTSEADLHFEEFLRSAEPPAHDRWDHRQERVQQAYKTGGGQGRTVKQALDQIGSDIDDFLRKEAREEVPSGSRGPEELIRLLTFGKRRGERKRSQKMHLDSGTIDFKPTDRRWTVEGASYGLVNESPDWESDDHAWGASISVSVSEDGGKGNEGLVLENFVTGDGCDVGEISDDGRSLIIQASAGARRVEFGLTAELPEGLDTESRTCRVAVELGATYLAGHIGD